ncbi:MAG: T9SS type A sorting domain-containing protein [Chlorobi bacterium]|nr:T9SS type A sorting domain-containing protein [Chlorobiota bacterium]MCI0715934.1 T9SS type A sorting domain-containing protein [Chlorobiota bacterium]
MEKLLLILCFTVLTNLYSQYYYNQYANFDGVNDLLIAPPNPDFNLDSAFTIEGWIFVQDTIGTNKTIISTVNSSLSSGYALLVQGSSSNPGNAGKLQLNLNGGNNNFVQTAATRLALNGWSHFSVSFRNAAPNNDTIRFYINGTLIQSFTSNVPPLSNSSDSVRIGNWYTPVNFANALRGRLDDLRIYKTVKTSAIIPTDRGIPLGMDLFFNVSLLSGSNYYRFLVSAWNFNGNGNDRVGSYNNLSAFGGAFYGGNGFNPDNYRTQGNYYMRFPGSSWLSADDGTNSIYDLDTACTIEAWVYIDAYRTQPQTIVSKGTSGYSYILAIGSSPSNSPIFILNSGTKLIQSSKAILRRVWTHIAATYVSSTGQMSLFVNGVLDTNRTFSAGNINLTNDSFYVGRSLFGEYMYGSIDAIKISKYAKSQLGIQSFLHTSVDNLNYSGGAGLQSSYNFEGNTIDNISNGNILIPRINVYFERLNNTGGAGGAAQAPLLRTSNSDAGFQSTAYFISNNRLHIGNGTTIRDSVLINNISGTNRLSVVLLMNHTNAADVTVNLRAPNGTNINLIASLGGTNNDIMTVFDDLADSLANTSLVPFSMRVRPVIPLSSLPQSNQNGYWRISVTDNASTADSGRVYMWGLKFISTVGVQNGNGNLPDKFAMYQNYPNPFNPVTNFKFQIPKTSFVKLIIYDLFGREVTTLVNEKLNAGTYEFKWDGSNYASGVYFYRFQTDEFKESRKMLFIK